MARDHDIPSFGDRIVPQGLSVVNHMDPQTLGRDAGGLGQGLGPGTLIDVAADRGHRGDPSQGIDEIRAADVARVQDAADAFESHERFGAKQAVGIGDDADAPPGNRLGTLLDGCSSCSMRAWDARGQSCPTAWAPCPKDDHPAPRRTNRLFAPVLRWGTKAKPVRRLLLELKVSPGDRVRVLAQEWLRSYRSVFSGGRFRIGLRENGPTIA